MASRATRTGQIGRRPATTKDRISEVGLTLFASRGFDDTSIDDIADAAGIARRTFFRYFPSKNALPWGDFDVHLGQMRRDLLDIHAVHTWRQAHGIAPRVLPGPLSNLHDLAAGDATTAAIINVITTAGQFQHDIQNEPTAEGIAAAEAAWPRQTVCTSGWMNRIVS